MSSGVGEYNVYLIGDTINSVVSASVAGKSVNALTTVQNGDLYDLTNQAYMYKAESGHIVLVAEQYGGTDDIKPGPRL
jgi:hypothetical protein